MSCNGWVDRSGNLYLTSSYGGATVWKYNAALDQELWPYRNENGGLEYVNDVLTDANDNVFIAGFDGSWAGGGSRCVKLSKDGHMVWEKLSKHTEGKDAYDQQLALDSAATFIAWVTTYRFPSICRHEQNPRAPGDDGSVIMDQRWPSAIAPQAAFSRMPTTTCTLPTHTTFSKT